MCYLVIIVLIMASSWQWGKSANADEIESSQQKPLNQTQRYNPCQSGPTSLNQIDALERENREIPSYSYQGKSISEEVYAEILIKDCSKEVTLEFGKLELLDCPPCKSIVVIHQKNLDYMKWWLQNRRVKKQER